MADPKTRASEMKLQIKHGSNKFDMHVKCPDAEVLMVKHLASAIFEKTGIPFPKQKIVCKGKTLTNPDMYLRDAGLVNGSKIMLLGKKPDPVENKEMQKLLCVEKEVQKQYEEFSKITYIADGIHRGPKHLDANELKQVKKSLSCCDESFMKLLESLDALHFEEHDFDGREKRRTLVKRIQELLSRCDGLIKGVDDMQTRLDFGLIQSTKQ